MESQSCYTLKLAVTVDGKKSDAKEVRSGFGNSQYELSLLDSAGHLERVEVFRRRRPEQSRNKLWM